jgi:hypothetical protein
MRERERERERHRGVAKYCNGFAAHRLEKTMQSYTRNPRVGASMSGGDLVDARIVVGLDLPTTYII